MTIPEAAVQWAVKIANDQSHGYSQQSRYGPDYDCSSLALSAYKQAGVPIDFNKVCYTGNMQNLIQYGFKDVTSKVNLNTGNGLQRGDILWWHKSGNQGHTAIYIGNNQIVHARGQSYGSPKTGDQGSEIAVTPYYRGSWQHVYRYVGGGSAKPAPTPTPTPTVKRYPVSTQMPIIKYGSVSKAVKVWQIIIGVEADGEFGKNTLAATLQFQRASGLEDDGEVGPKTWGVGLSII
jgi:cell wall-associated NlpC family hydrolase